MKSSNSMEMSCRQQKSTVIDKTWDGEPVGKDEQAGIIFSWNESELRVDVDAPWHRDPAPPVPVGECEGLWNYEVVELFLLGARGHYLEIELGPQGHYLVLHLSGIRRPWQRLRPRFITSSIDNGKWQASMIVKPDPSLLPFTHVNAYAIHGQGTGRRYLAAFTVPGDKPDFHQPRFFGSLARLPGCPR